jgi:hypothetical protein
MSQPLFAVGDRVRVKHGVVDADYPDLPLGGWTGTVVEVDADEPRAVYLVRWSPETLQSTHPVYRRRCERDGCDAEEYWVWEEDLEPDPGGPLEIEQPASIVPRPLSMDDPDDRVRAVFGLTWEDPLPPLSQETHRQYYDYLKTHLSFPFEARYLDQTGPLGMTRHAHTVSVVAMLDDFPIDETHGAMCEAQEGQRRWELPLSQLELSGGSPNQQLIKDYLYWFYDAEEGNIDDDEGGASDERQWDDQDEFAEDDEAWDEGLDEDDEGPPGDEDDEDVDGDRRDWPQEKPAPIVRTEIRVGRNDPCPCGSGRKFKKCCLGKAKSAEPIE